MPDHPTRQLTQPGSADLLYDRTVSTRLSLPSDDRVVAEATLVDDTHGPGGFQTIHHMTLRATVSVPDGVIVSAEASMRSHPHGWCPETVAHVDALVGLRIASGYYREVNRLLGGSRSCNHLLTLAQSIGAVVAVSYATRMSVLDPSLRDLDDDDYFREVVREHDAVVGSCYVWRGDGPLVADLELPRRSER